MKILSKYKDFYDYVAGSYGVDEKLILDRRDFQILDPLYLKEGFLVKLYIGGMHYEGYLYNGKFYWGEKLFEIVKGEIPYYEKWKNKDIDRKTVYVKGYDSLGRASGTTVMYEGIESDINDRTGVPILLAHPSGTFNPLRNHYFLKNPRLSDFDFNKMLSGEEVWMLLSNWLSKQKDKPIINQQTDKEKIVSKGFDLKQSFRHRKS